MGALCGLTEVRPCSITFTPLSDKHVIRDRRLRSMLYFAPA
jgi:hypothetical protein